MKPEKEILFSGNIESLISHELRNILGIIKENTGLLKDLLLRHHDLNESDKFTDILERIQKQIKSGEKTIFLLNRFSHLMENKKKSFNINSSITTLLSLMERKLKQKETKIRLNIFHNVSIKNYQFYFIMINYYIIDEIIKYFHPAQEVEINCIKGHTIQLSYKSAIVEKIGFEQLEDSLAPYLAATGILLQKNKNIIIMNIT